jgi:flavin reductase (DIM6/NTAB) family NADH-FMN oxidoreductase RutF
MNNAKAHRAKASAPRLLAAARPRAVPLAPVAASASAHPLPAAPHAEAPAARPPRPRPSAGEQPAPAPKRPLPLSKVYGLLETGPVVLLTTSHQGAANVMTMSWHTMMEFEPPLVGCVVSQNDFSFTALNATRECVLNIPTADLAAQVVGCGNASGADVDKFAQFGLTPVPASVVASPLIAECYANLECRVVDTRLKNRYNFFVLEVIQAWIDPSIKAPQTLHHRGHGLFMVAGETIKLASKMR